MRNTSISLSDHWVAFTTDLVASGRYGSISEVVREGLRLVEERQARIEALDDAIQVGLDSGPAVPFSYEAFIDQMRARHAERAAAE